MEAPLENARRVAGLTVQAAVVFPVLILVAMGLGAPDASFTQLLPDFSDWKSIAAFAGLLGIPLLGLAVGVLVKRGSRFAYVLAAMLAVGSFFVVFPFPLLGLLLLYQLGRICVYEFR